MSKKYPLLLHRSRLASLAQASARSLIQPSKLPTWGPTILRSCRASPIGYRRTQSLAITRVSAAHRAQFLHASPTPSKEDFERAQDEGLEPPLEDYELEELYAGRFPANYEGDLIHLRNLSKAEIERIRTAFDKNKDESVDRIHYKYALLFY
jgi:hypothetical protein